MASRAGVDVPPHEVPLEDRGLGRLLESNPIGSATDLEGTEPISRSLASAVRILRDDLGQVLRGAKVEWNEQRLDVTLGRSPLQDVDVVRVRVAIEQTHRVLVKKHFVPLQLTKEQVFEAMRLVAAERPYHPVRELLRSLRWDGHPRCSELLEWLGAEDSPMHRALVGNWRVGTVARVMDPGCQMDNFLTLTGKQGIGKTTFFRTMAMRPEWFSDSKIDMDSDDGYEKLEGIWIFELGELASLNKREWETIKSFISAREDKLHRRYDRTHHVHRRDGVMVGTTNHDQHLNDPTGARRFWPVRCDRTIDRRAVEDNREQIWAEAVHLYDTQKRWHLSQEEEDQLAAHQKRFTVVDEWKPVILRWFEDHPGKFRISFIMEQALKIPIERVDMAGSKKVSYILKNAGYESRMTDGYPFWNSEWKEA